MIFSEICDLPEKTWIRKSVKTMPSFLMTSWLVRDLKTLVCWCSLLISSKPLISDSMSVPLTRSLCNTRRASSCLPVKCTISSVLSRLSEENDSLIFLNNEYCRLTEKHWISLWKSSFGVNFYIFLCVVQLHVICLVQARMRVYYFEITTMCTSTTYVCRNTLKNFCRHQDSH